LAMRTTGSAHRVVHFAAFGASALLLVSMSRSSSQKMAALLTVIGIAVSVELLQHVIYGCSFEAWDVRDDTLAAIAGYTLARLNPRTVT